MPKRKANGELTAAAKLQAAIDKSKKAIQIKSIVPDGNIQLELDDGCKGLIVRRQTLCAASLVFRRMLDEDSPFREGQESRKNADGMQIIRLEDDDSTSMSIVMRIIHWQCQAVPQELQLYTLYGVARLCDKYDLGKSLQPWPRLWIRPYLDGVREEESVGILFIAITFGLGDLFSSMTKHLILHTVLDDDGLLHLPIAVQDEIRYCKWDAGVPHSVIGTSRDHSPVVNVLQISAICWEPLRKLRTGLQCKGSKQRDIRVDCDTINTGRVLRKFAFLNDHPDKLPPHNQSVGHLLNSIDNIKCLGDMTGLSDAFLRTHAGTCDIFHAIKQGSSSWLKHFQGLELETVTPAPGPSPPAYVTRLIEAQRPESHFFEPVMRYIAVNADGRRNDYFFDKKSADFDFGFDFEPFIRCLDCPNRVFRENRIIQHVQERLHVQRRQIRIDQHGRDFIPGPLVDPTDHLNKVSPS